MKLSNAFGYALLGTCLYGAVMNSFPTNEEKDAVGEIDATNEVERAGCAAVLGLKTTLGMTQGEIVAAIRGDQRGGGALASSDVEDSDLLLRRRISTAEGVAKRCLQWCASSPHVVEWRLCGSWWFGCTILSELAARDPAVKFCRLTSPLRRRVRI